MTEAQQKAYSELMDIGAKLRVMITHANSKMQPLSLSAGSIDNLRTAMQLVFQVQREMEKIHYVQVVGPNDTCFVGPFDSAAAAHAFADNQKDKKRQFDFYPVTEAEMALNIAEFGKCPIQTPAEFNE